MKTLANGLSVSHSDIKKFLQLKKENYQAKFQQIEKHLQNPESYQAVNLNEKKQQHKDRTPRSGNDVCFFFIPGDVSALDAEYLEEYNRKAVSIYGDQVENYKTVSDYNPEDKEMQIACMSGQYDRYLYPNDRDLFFGIGFNETCARWIDTIHVPDGFSIPQYTDADLTVQFRLGIRNESDIYQLRPGNSGVRLHDLVGVMGTVFMKVEYTDPETNEETSITVSQNFLDKFKSSDTPLIGFFDRYVRLNANIRIGRNNQNVFPPITITSIVNISAYTGKNFKPGEVFYEDRQFAIVDLREQGLNTPPVTLDTSKKGGGGVSLQWIRMCLPEAGEL